VILYPFRVPTETQLEIDVVGLLYLLDIARSKCTTYEKSWLKLAKSIWLFMMAVTMPPSSDFATCTIVCSDAGNLRKLEFDAPQSDDRFVVCGQA
jgi:hypothetical protein